MFELKYVSLRNFRSHVDTTFVPLPAGAGISALSGPNGSGKSSILYALVWCLYGKTPDGVTVGGIRRHGCTDPTEVEVGFVHHGQHIEVSRGIRGRNDTSTASVRVDGVPVSEISARSAVSWVTQRLGLDYEGFTTAFVVLQKEVETLMSATASERRRIVERLAGIERLSQAVSYARGEVREHERLVAATTPSDDLPAAQAEVDAITGELDTIATRRDTAAADLTAIAVERESLTASVRELMIQQDTWTQLRDRQERFEMQEQSLSAIVDELPEPMSDDQIAALRSACASKRAELDAAEADHQGRLLAQERLDVLRGKVAELREQQFTLDTDLTNLRTSMHALTDQLATAEDTRATLTTAEQRLRDADATLMSRQAQLAAIDQAVSLLDSTATGVCPTCRQHITDPRTVQEHWQRERDILTNEHIPAAEQQVRLATSERDALAHRVEVMRTQEEDRRALLTRIGEKETHAEHIAQQIVDAIAREDDHRRQMDTWNTDAEQGLDALRAEVHECDMQLLAAEKAQSARERRSELLAQRRHVRHQLLRISAAMSAIPIEEIRADIAHAQQRLFEAETREQQVREEAARVNERYANVRAMAQMKTEHLQRVQRDHERHQQASAQVYRLQETAKALELFRVERLHRLAPDISEVASDYLHSITHGTFAGVRFDTDFTATITTSTGEERVYSQLSGGEAELVSLVLRLGISHVIAGDHAGLLFLDEVLTAQDTQRRSAALAALRSSQRQVIIINHAVDSDDYVDAITDITDPRTHDLLTHTGTSTDGEG